MTLPFPVFLAANYLLVLPVLLVPPERDVLLLSSSSLLLLVELFGAVDPLLLPVAVDFLVPAVVEPEACFSSLEEPCFSMMCVCFRKMVSVCFRYNKKRRAVLVETTRAKKTW